MANEGTARHKDQAINGQELSKKWAQLVAHADDKLKQRLKENPAPVLREHGFDIPKGYAVHVVEDASPRLYLNLTQTQAADSAELTADQLSNVAGGVRKAGENPLEYLKITFGDVLVSSY